MRNDQIVRILDGIQGVRKDGASYVLPDAVEFSVFVGIGSEVLTVTRIARVEASAEMLTVDTQKGERFHFGMDHVAGVKTAPAEKSPAARGAGFR